MKKEQLLTRLQKLKKLGLKLLRNRRFLIALMIGVVVVSSIFASVYFSNNKGDQKVARASATDCYYDNQGLSSSQLFACYFENQFFPGTTGIPEPFRCKDSTSNNITQANVGDNITCAMTYWDVVTTLLIKYTDNSVDPPIDHFPGEITRYPSQKFLNGLPGKIYFFDGQNTTLCGNASDFVVARTFNYTAPIPDPPTSNVYTYHSLSCTITPTNYNVNKGGLTFYYSETGDPAAISSSTDYAFPLTPRTRILDCRVSGQSVPPIIVPNYAQVGNDIFGLTMDAQSNLYLLNGPDRSLYGGGVSGVSTKDDLYSSPISMTKLTPSTANKNAPGSVSNIDVTGLTGRPMDLDMKSFKGTDNNIYIYGLRKIGNDDLTGTSDVEGRLAGFIAVVNKDTGGYTILDDGASVGGYEKAFADISVNNFGQIFFDDVRSQANPANIYNVQTKVELGVISIPYVTYPDNTFFDIASDSTRGVYSIYNKTDLYKNGVRMNLTFPTNSDGGDIEVADADKTYNTTLTGDDYIYYTAGGGVGSGPSLVRVNQQKSNSTIKSNEDPIDSNFTAANTGYMDKVAFDFANQIIYYKNGARSWSNPDQTIGKIYCPDPATTPATYTPPPLIPQNVPPGVDDNQVTPGGNPNSSSSTPNSSTPSSSSTPTSSSTSNSSTSTSISSSSSSSPTAPKLTLAKTSDTGGKLLKSGDIVIYTLTVGNSGNGPSTAFIVNDNLPSLVTFSGVSSCVNNFPGGVTISACSYDSVNKRLTWDITSLPAGSSGSVSFKVVVN